MDGDEQRRHRDTVWKVHGPAQAILVGDALFALANEVLLELGTAEAARATRRLTTATRALIDGQGAGHLHEHRDRVSVEECLETEGNKTGALLACASSVGAVLGGADDRTADALEKYGYHLGLAFQAVDDLLGIWGDPGVDRQAEPAALFVRGEQREDGTWSSFYGGPGELSTTIEAYVALRLAGDAPDAPHMAKASAWIRERGGNRRRPGLHPDLAGPVRLVEVGGPARTPAGADLLPPGYRSTSTTPGCWARQTIVPLTIVSAKRPVRPSALPARRTAHRPGRPQPTQAPGIRGELGWRLPETRQGPARAAQGRTAQAAQGGDELRRPLLDNERQENDGCWGGIQPPAVYSVIALHLLGYDLEHPVMRAGLESLDRFAVWREDGARMIEACQSPVWDTCLATIALADAGVPAPIIPNWSRPPTGCSANRLSGPETGR
ncbi:hypothetical protein SALBM311S_10834 [Streptomyces alboniger]